MLGVRPRGTDEFFRCGRPDPALETLSGFPGSGALMPRLPTLTYDRGTLILHPPPRGKAWVEHAEWDDRVERFRIPADRYRPLVEALAAEGTAIEDHARAFTELPLKFADQCPRAAPSSGRGARCVGSRRSARRRGAAHRGGQDICRATRPAIDLAKRAGGRADARSAAPMVRRTARSVPRRGSRFAGRRFARLRRAAARLHVRFGRGGSGAVGQPFCVTDFRRGASSARRRSRASLRNIPSRPTGSG